MVLVERSCPKCGAICEAADITCGACGVSLKITLPLDEDVDAVPTLRLTHHLQANSLFKERYQIIRQVGVGGFGAAYEAEDTQEKRRVAIKEIGLAGLTPQQVIEATGSFNREVEMLSSLQHHSIPQMYAQLMDTEHWYLVMEFITGTTLEERLAKADGSHLSLEHSLRIGVQVCDVLEYLHSRQPAVIFRDIKPANIMLTSDGQLYLIDFGVARQYKPGKSKDTIAFGSPGYAAPEQYGRAQTTPRTDIYSLGALLHQMLTGQDPSLSPFRFLPLSIYDRSFPAELEKLVSHMLEPDMAHRPESAAEVKHQLQSIMSLGNVVRKRKIKTRTGGARAPLSLASAPAVAKTFSTIGVTVSIYRRHATTVNALAWSPDGSSLASGDDDRFVSIWNAFQPSSHHILPPGNIGPINDLAWSPDGQALATASEDHTVRLWNVNAHPAWWQMLEFSMGFRTHSYTLHESSVNALSWSPDGDMIASAEERNAVHVWDAHTRELLLIYRGHSDVVEDVAWSPDRLRIASCSIDHTTRVWGSVNGKSLWHWRPKGGSVVHALAWSPDARYLACGTSDGRVHVWDTLQERQVYTYRGHKGSVNCVAWSPDGQRLASAGSDGTVHLRHALDDKNPFTYSHYEEGSLLAVAWSPDGQHLASAGQDTEVHIWKAV